MMRLSNATRFSVSSPRAQMLVGRSEQLSRALMAPDGETLADYCQEHKGLATT
jgi:hypothetical protein